MKKRDLFLGSLFLLSLVTLGFYAVITTHRIEQAIVTDRQQYQQVTTELITQDLQSPDINPTSESITQELRESLNYPDVAYLEYHGLKGMTLSAGQKETITDHMTIPLYRDNQLLGTLDIGFNHHSLHRLIRALQHLQWLFLFGGGLITAGLSWIFLRRAEQRFQHQNTEIANNLRAAKEHAEAASQVKSSFIASITHEIRTPMNGVLGTLELLQETPLNEEQRLYVTTAFESAQQLLRLIDDVLDFSKLESGKFTLITTAFSFSDLIDSIVLLMRPKALQKKLVFSAEIDANIPPVLYSDPGRIRQILLNLLSNAIKFTEQGNISLSINMTAKDEENCTLQVTVSDTGVGIQQHMIPHLFEEFTQQDPSITRRADGTGLGLAITEQLLHLFQSQLQVESQLDKGSRFYFTLTLRHRDRRLARREPVLTDTTTVTPAHSQALILVVDDSDTNRLIITRYLDKLGYINLGVSSGAEALQALGSKKYAAILTDLAMPQMDGYTLSATIREQDKHIPIVAITASTDKALTARIENSGINCVLTKPFTRKQLGELLHSILIAPKQAMELLDPQQLALLQADLPSKQDFQDTLQHFIHEAKERISDLQKAVATHDIETLEHHAHTLKGSAAMFGAVQLQQLSEHIELACQTGKPEEALQLASLLGAEAEKTFVAFQAYL
jgi:signal transduction histidine kinase/CheY-like chemotaxis protein